MNVISLPALNMQLFTDSQREVITLIVDVVNELSDQQSTVVSDLDTIKTAVDNLESDCRDFASEETTREIEKRIETLEETVGSLESIVSDLTNKFEVADEPDQNIPDSKEQSVSQVRPEIGVM